MYIIILYKSSVDNSDGTILILFLSFMILWKSKNWPVSNCWKISKCHSWLRSLQCWQSSLLVMEIAINTNHQSRETFECQFISCLVVISRKNYCLTDENTYRGGDLDDFFYILWAWSGWRCAVEMKSSCPILHSNQQEN